MQLDKEDIRSYDQRTFLDAPQKKEVNPLSIFFAVLAAILASWLIREAYVEWQVRQAVEVFNQQMQIINAQSQQQMQSIQLQNEAIKASAEEDARAKEEKLRQQKLAAQQLDNDKRNAIAAAIEERTKKEEAWSYAYKPIIGCEKDNPNRDAIKCGNDYAKAHRQFELSWANSH